MMKKKKNNKIKIPIIPFIFSSFLLIFGTYAWFTYFSDVDSTMTGHVIGWNIDFDGKTNIENKYSIVIDNIYPGMKDYVNEFKITNHGEIGASITSSIVSVQIFDEVYKVGDLYQGENLTSEKIYEILKTKYPFKMDFQIDNPIIYNEQTSIFKFSLLWPFETYIKTTNFEKDKEYYILDNDTYKKVILTEEEFNLQENIYELNDEEDTFWGTKSYEYKNKNPDDPCIKLEIMINANQYTE